MVRVIVTFDSEYIAYVQRLWNTDTDVENSVAFT